MDAYTVGEGEGRATLLLSLCLVILLKCCFLALLSGSVSLVLSHVRFFFFSDDPIATVTALQTGRSPY